ncbi:MAG: GTPase domain-containing protein [Maricaulaceae bacterium]
MPSEWALPALKAAYENREAISAGWRKVLDRLRGPQNRIAFVGPGGVGKTVLLDHLTGRAFAKGYEPPGTSRKAERGAARAAGNRLAITVAPGQYGQKIDAFNDAFAPERPVDGVVFVTAHGFTTVLDQTAMKSNIEEGYDSIEKWRGLQFREDRQYLELVLNLMASAHRKSGKPQWMLVAVSKCDLFQSEIEAAEKYYSPYFHSPFSDILRKFRNDVGRNYFEWNAAPVCAWLEAFEWGQERVAPGLDLAARNHYLAKMTQRMGELCRA